MKIIERYCSTLFTFLFAILLAPSCQANFDHLEEFWNLDILYHYARIERSNLTETQNFQSRQGAMLQFAYEDQYSLAWRWYLGGDVSFAQYEAASSVSFGPREQWPWQLYIGNGFQFGELKNFEIFFGAGGSSETYITFEGIDAYKFHQGLSARVHAGFQWRLLSITNATTTFFFRYSLPVTEVHQAGVPLSYRGVVDCSLRLKSEYDSLMSLYGGVRFEDYKLSNQSVSYFTSRLYLGLGLHFR